MQSSTLVAYTKCIYNIIVVNVAEAVLLLFRELGSVTCLKHDAPSMITCYMATVNLHTSNLEVLAAKSLTPKRALFPPY